MILMGFDPNFGVDKYFYRKAVEDGKTTSGLESPRYQVDLLSSLSDSGEEDFLIQTIEEYDSASVMLDELVGFWRSGDLEGLQKTMNKSIMKYPELHKKLLVDRNLAWMDRIEEILRGEEDYMIIVGAGHLAGEQGLINLLKQKGYAVTQP
jgi:hypothetical protein